MTVTRYKVAALEIAAVEQAFATEVPLDASNVYFPATDEIVADNLQDAVAAASHYSWALITTTTRKVIPANQQMLVYQELEITSGGELELIGEVVILS